MASEGGKLKRKRPRINYWEKQNRPENRPQRQKRVQEKPSVEWEPRWTCEEKEKLIHALHRYSPSCLQSIANVIGTKNAVEVENIIRKVVNSALCDDYKQRTVETDPEKGAAPLELWLSLVEELSEGKMVPDYSGSYSKVLDLIARNEPMPDQSGFPDLNWNHLYRYICDALEDKATLQSLTDMESLVMLDMMHNLGDTLHASDTKEQRKLLDLKYQLYKQQSLIRFHSQDSTRFKPGLQAYFNDFHDVEYTEVEEDASASKTTTNTSTSSRPSSSTPLTSSVVVVGKDSITVTSQPPPPAADEPAASSSTPSSSSLSTGEATTSAGPVSSSPSPSTCAQTAGPVASQLEQALNDITSFIPSEFFSLNPLTIPDRLLSFLPKDLSLDKKQIPVIIDIE